MNWFQTAKTEVEKVEQRAEEIAISLDAEALQAVEWFENTLHAGLDELTALQSRLENDIADKTEALEAVKDAIAKAKSVVPQPAPAPQPEPAPAPAEPQP